MEWCIFIWEAANSFQVIRPSSHTTESVDISFALQQGMEWNTPTPPPLAAKKLSLLNNGSPQEILLLVVACQDTHEFSCREVARQFQLEKFLYSHTHEDTLFYSTTLFIRGVLKNYRANSSACASKTEKTFHRRDFCPKHWLHIDS